MKQASSSNIPAFIQQQPPRYAEHLSVTEGAAKTQTRVGTSFSDSFSDSDQRFSFRWVSTLAVWNVLSLMHFSLIHGVAACSCVFFSLLLAPHLRALSWTVCFTQSVHFFFFPPSSFTFRHCQRHLIKQPPSTEGLLAVQHLAAQSCLEKPDTLKVS